MKALLFLTVASFCLVSHPAQAALQYSLGEADDAVVLVSDPLAAQTVEAGGKNLALVGAGGAYVAGAPGGSTLAAGFDGGQFYSGESLAFYVDFDANNFTLSFDVNVASTPSFHIAVCFGRYGGGASFIYTTGDSWRYHIGGVGDQIVGGTVTPGQWQHIELVRGAGVTSLWVDGTLVGSDPDFPTPSDDFSIGAAKHGDGTADGAFLGAIDNVRLTGAEDTDGDGLPNAWETQHNLNPTSDVGDDGATGDPDQDTFDNQAEFAAGSDPRNAASVPGDTDADGLADAWEAAVFGNLSQTGTGDADGDLATNEEEETAGTDAASAQSWPDADSDGLNDAWEVFHFRTGENESVATILAKHTGTDDPDADGFDNFAEQAAGSNPTLASSKPSAGLTFHLGEEDAAAAGGALAASTAEVSGKNLTLTGTGGTYTAEVPAGGTTLAAAFTGTQFYTAGGKNFFNGIDWQNFSLSLDVRVDSVTSFHVPVSLGRYGSGSAFLYTTGGDWRFHINGAGDRITGGTVTLGAWQRLELRCVAGEVQLHVDGALVGTTTEFPASLSDDFSIASAKNGSGGPDGRFVGAIDNVVLKAIGTDADGDGLPDDWETANGLDPADPSGGNGADGDADGDGRSNYAEWAFGGHPALADAQATAGAVQLVDFLGTPYLHATFPCRTGAVFDGGVPSVAEVDGIRYAIEASADLAGPALSVVEVTPALASQLPPLPAGYEWRTFRLTDSAGVRPAAFIRVSATKP